VEIDEMHSYIASKKTIAGYGLLLIDMEKIYQLHIGGSRTVTGRQLGHPE